MPAYGTVHLIFLGATLLFFVAGWFIVPKIGRAAQNVLFVAITVLCSGGIFFRYGMGMKFGGAFTPGTLAMEMLQVCNFNFILLPLMLIPKFELARQYSCMFSMVSAITTFLSPASSWADLEWYSATVLNSWLNHVFAVALPLFMMAARRLKPQKKYVLPVLGCVFAYFTIVAGVSWLLIENGVITAENSFSFVFNTEGIIIFDLLYELIPVPYFYLYPLLIVLYLYFRLLAWAARKRQVIPFTYRAPKENAIR